MKKWSTGEHLKIESLFHDAFGRDMTAEEDKILGFAAEAYPSEDPTRGSREARLAEFLRDYEEKKKKD